MTSKESDVRQSDTTEDDDTIGSKESDAKDGNNSAVSAKLGCKHYKRLCKLKAACCSQLHWCRFCHDDENAHEMNRHAVQEVQCTSCDTIQTVSNKCEKCSAVFGDYFCSVCRLYDTDQGQFHCDKCGICRVGPRDDFFHCDICNACLHTSLIGNHKCVENMSMSVCPICRELLHTSRQTMHIPRCGHMIHSKCLESCYKQGLYQCTMCKESLLDMSNLWKEMDAACASVVLPEDLKHVKLSILCQDCHQTAEVPFNTEGLKCAHCGSYNTTQS